MMVLCMPFVDSCCLYGEQKEPVCLCTCASKRVPSFSIFILVDFQIICIPPCQDIYIYTATHIQPSDWVLFKVCLSIRR